MPDSPDILRLRTLLCFLNEDSQICSVSNIARSLNVEKYIISRILASLEKEGLVDRSVPRKPMLTAAGVEEAMRYADRIKTITNHLVYEGIGIEDAAQDAMYGALYNSENYMNSIRASEEMYRVKYELRNQTTFSGSALCKKLTDGSYQLPFLFYREHIKDNNNLSMANGGFHQPCILTIKNRIGTVKLRLKEVVAKSGLSGNAMTGHVQNLKYFDHGRYVSAEASGNVVSFQASALNFINMGSGTGQILHGSICLQMECTVGTVHMPQSKAIFTILI